MAAKSGNATDAMMHGMVEEKRSAERLTEMIWDVRIVDALLADAGLSEERKGVLKRVRSERVESIATLLVSWQSRGGTFALVPSDVIGMRAVHEAESLPTLVRASEPPMDAHAELGREPVFQPSAPTPRIDDLAPLRALVRELAVLRTPPLEVAFLLALVRDTARLNRVFPTDARLDALAYAVARVRHLCGSGLAREETDLLPCLSAVTAYALMAQIGAVYGPSRTHAPRKGSWANDATFLLSGLARVADVDLAPNPEKCVAQLEVLVGSGGADGEIRDAVLRCFDAGVGGKDVRLVRILTPVLHALDGKRFKDIRAAIRETLAKDGDAEVEATAPVPPDWPYWHLTRGKRAVMVGGDVREPNRQRIELAFGFASLRWEPTGFKKRGLASLRDSVECGGVDIVIVLTPFIGHDTDGILLPACRARGVPFVPVHTGYGIVGIREAIQRHGS